MPVAVGAAGSGLYVRSKVGCGADQCQWRFHSCDEEGEIYRRVLSECVEQVGKHTQIYNEELEHKEKEGPVATWDAHSHQCR